MQFGYFKHLTNRIIRVENKTRSDYTNSEIENEPLLPFYIFNNFN